MAAEGKGQRESSNKNEYNTIELSGAGGHGAQHGRRGSLKEGNKTTITKKAWQDRVD